MTSTTPSVATGSPWLQPPHASGECDAIEALGFSGYFLIVYDICWFARLKRILYQGRGSAANSQVCYVLDITAVDSLLYGLPFERFLASTREEEPDIDVDFDAGRREEVIQYVYGKYGRENAAQVANVISYKPKSAIRDAAKALGYSVGQQDAWSKQVDGWSPDITTGGARDDGKDSEIPQRVVSLASELLKFPRHLGIHSGGMVLTERPVGQVVPIEYARKEKRTVLQWDKDDCAWMGLVKFDLLGLGMLAALQYVIDLVKDTVGEEWSLQTIPKEEAGVYDQLCRADSVGVFQVESRAQMATLPRLLPRRFYDLVCEIALIRPGPIQGKAVHPFIRRRAGEEPITYLHPKLQPVLERTLGIPLFQEQLMQMAMAVGGIDGGEADLLRRAMGSKRGLEKIGSLKTKLYAGMADNGITGELADEIYDKIEAFANFGFAESHLISFGLLVYSSTWFRVHYPAAFLAALLRAQPMGFYSPQSLVADARRHGVEVRRPDLQLSGAGAELEQLLDGQKLTGPTGDPACLVDPQPIVGPFDPDAPFDTRTHRRDGAYAVRLDGRPGPPDRDHRGRAAADAARHVRDRDRHGRSVVDQHHHQHPPGAADPRAAARRRDPVRGRAPPGQGRLQGPRRGRHHPPPRPRHRLRRHLHEPRGRDRHDQHRHLRRRLEPPRQSRPHRRRRHRSRPAHRPSRQPQRRAPCSAAAGRQDEVPRFSLNSGPGGSANRPRFWHCWPSPLTESAPGGVSRWN
jgi:error-prone DNA polymerase